MKRPALLTRRAERELLEAVARIAEDRPDAAEQFYQSVQNALRVIGDNPSIGVRRPALAALRFRFWSVPRYRFLLVYTDATLPARVVRIVHTSRDLPRALAELLP